MSYTSAMEAASPVKAGDVLAGKYRVDRVLGVGGMGVVVAARHIHLDQRVALKFMLPHVLGNAEAVKKYPLQVISAAVHYFIGASFQEVPRLEEMMARPTFEVSPEDAMERGIRDGDFCRLYNDRGETFGYARIMHGLKQGVLGAPKAINGSSTPGGVNVNAIISQRVADMGGAPVFFSTLAQLEKAPLG